VSLQACSGAEKQLGACCDEKNIGLYQRSTHALTSSQKSLKIKVFSWDFAGVREAFKFD